MSSSILVVEDSRTQAEELRFLLETAGFGVRVAFDGETALAAVETTAFDLVITDVTMPGMDGYEVCRRIKQERRLDVPVILLTGLTDPMAIVRGLEAGADNYVTKPYDAQQLVARVRHVLANRRVRRGLKSEMGVTITFLGSTFTITSGREQILDLLISTFEDVVLQNRQLRMREEELEAARAQLARYAGTLEARLQSVLQTVPEVLFSLGGGAKELYYVSPACVRLLGFTPEEFAADPDRWLTAIEADDRPTVVTAYDRLVREGRTGVLDFRVRHRDGTVRWLQATIIPVADEGGTVTRVDGVISDITARKAAEEELRAQEEFLRQVIDTSPNLIFVKDPDGRFLLANRAVAELYGTTAAALIGRTEADVNANPDEAERYLAADREVARTGRPKLTGEETVTPASGGPPRSFQTVRVPLAGPGGSDRRVLGIGTDITDRKLLEQQLRLAQKMEAVGTLAAGVAHDFNNLLAAIRATTELLLLDVPAGSPAEADLKQITAVVDRGRALTRQLLAFGRDQEIEPKPVDVRQLVESVRQMLERIIGEDIRLTVEQAPEPATVVADPGQLEQILLNLCVNARDAMPQGGQLAIMTERVLVDQEFCTLHPWARPGEYVVLAVSDTGIGMSAETQARIFEPFFTTKEMGKGTGLGLAVVYGIVKRHEGMIHVYSEPGRGTTFRIYLPYGAVTPASEAAVQTVQVEGGSETLLLAEDDDVLRDATRKLLERLGYRVLLASNGSEALDLLQARGDEIDLAILDIVMPEVGGPAVIERLRDRCPNVRYIFTTGYRPPVDRTQRLAALPATVLHKPYGLAALARTVRQALTQRADGA